MKIYDLLQPDLTVIRTCFARWQIRTNDHAPKSTPHRKRTKLHEWGCTNWPPCIIPRNQSWDSSVYSTFHCLGQCSQPDYELKRTIHIETQIKRVFLAENRLVMSIKWLWVRTATSETPESICLISPPVLSLYDGTDKMWLQRSKVSTSADAKHMLGK